MVTGRGRRRVPAGRPAAVVGSLLVLAGAVMWMVAHQAPLVAVQRCVSPDRTLAWLGVHLAVLREHPGCAAGQLALDASPGHAAGLVVMVTAPTLLVNVFTMLGMLGCWAALRALAVRVADVLRRLWPALPTPPRVVVVDDVRPSRVVEAPRRRPWQLDRSPVLRRGPPVPVAL